MPATSAPIKLFRDFSCRNSLRRIFGFHFYRVALTQDAVYASDRFCQLSIRPLITLVNCRPISVKTSPLTLLSNSIVLVFWYSIMRTNSNEYVKYVSTDKIQSNTHGCYTNTNNIIADNNYVRRLWDSFQLNTGFPIKADVFYA